MKFTVLWTDCLIYLLVALALLFAIKAYFNPHLRKIWRKVIYRPLNLVAIVILISYAVIGLLDTVHLHETIEDQKESQTGMISLLDKILQPMILHTERTYSEPLATHSFTKEAMVLPDGAIVRDYPRLTYGGAHLTSLADKWQDIGHRCLIAFIQAMLIWTAISILLILMGSRKHRLEWEDFLVRIIKGKTHFPWRTLLLSIGFLLLIITIIHALMPYYHILGTDEVGEDVLYQTLKSIRTGLIIGTVTTLLTLPFAILFGIMAGYFRGWADDAIQYVYTTLSSIPAVLLIAAAVLTLQVVMNRHGEWFETVAHRTDARLLALCAILGITSWTGLCRLLRGETMKICQMDFVAASRTLGSSHMWIIFKHLLPNVFHIILITIVLDFSGLVLAEAVLSYVGVGVDPSTYSWGTMINSARLEMARVPIIWWSLTAAFVFMFVLVLSANIFSDAVRDAFDPRARLAGAR